MIIKVNRRGQGVSLRQAGFTLTELAIVLVIVGLVVAGMSGAVVTLMNRSEIVETRSSLDLFRQTVLGYASRMQRLPAYSLTDDDLTAILPKKKDFWGNPLIYLYDSELARSDLTGPVGPICAKKSTNITVRTCSNWQLVASTWTCAPADVVDQINIAMIVFSSGKNLLNQTDAAAAGVQHPETAPYTPYSGPIGGFVTTPRIVTIYEPGMNIGTYDALTANWAGLNNVQSNDDMVVAVSLDELRQRVGCGVKPLRLMNTDLPMGANGANYSVDVLAEGGIPISTSESLPASAKENYRWCVESSDAALSSDLIFQVKRRDGTDYAATTEYPAALRPLVAQLPNVCKQTSPATLETDTAKWVSGDMLRILGATAGKLGTSTGRTRLITVYVRDNQNNNATPTAYDDKDNVDFRALIVPINGT
jgi:prepilin-type N-terminal cleavage/methylation domain-containing protein